MRVQITMLLGFVIGVLLFGTGLQWLIDETAGPCPAECPAWRSWVPVLAMAVAWAASSTGIHVLWQRIRPRKAPSAFEERIRHLKRGGR